MSADGDQASACPPALREEVVRAAEKAYWDAGGITIDTRALKLAVLAAVVTDRSLQDAERVLADPSPDAACGACKHPHWEHIKPDSCFTIDGATACSCTGFRP